MNYAAVENADSAMNYAAVESAARNAWPAIEEQQMPYGILRFAHGYTRRANSLALFDAETADYETLLTDCETFFAHRAQPAMIRVPGLPFLSGLDKFLSTRGYIAEAPSLVMVQQLNDQPAASIAARRLERTSWLDNYYSISGKSILERCSHEQLISRIESEIFFAVIDNEQGIPACCALAINYNGVVGIYNVATASSFRRQQWASVLMTALLGWGRSAGASYAYLQVEESNLPAVSLYRKTGFSELYRYCYRVKKETDRLSLEVESESC